MKKLWYVPSRVAKIKRQQKKKLSSHRAIEASIQFSHKKESKPPLADQSMSSQYSDTNSFPEGSVTILINHGHHINFSKNNFAKHKKI